MRLSIAFSFVLGVFVVSASALPAEFVFPPDSGVIDVSQAPYHATGDGKTDATAAIQKALDDHPNGNRIIYMPDGVYLISDTLRWGTGGGGREQKRTILQGQSTDGTILRLPDACAGFTDLTAPKAMIWTGKKPAQRFRNGLRNFTVDVGQRNPGAIGVQYIANNQGSVRNLKIVCSDAGLIGLDLGYSDEQGPCLIKDVQVRGFDTGISLRTVVDSVTMESVALIGQRKVGIRNEGQVVSIRKLHSENAVPAIQNVRPASLLTLVDSELVGMAGAKVMAAIENTGAAFLRDVRSSGYQQLLADNRKDAAGVKLGTEWVSHEVLSAFPSRGGSLRLAVKETPLAPQDPLDQWASPSQFGGSPDDDIDDTDAVQKAVDSGKSTLYFPQGKNWKIDGIAKIRGNIHRVTALEGRITGTGKLQVVDGKSPVVVVDRIDMTYQKVVIENASTRTLALSGMVLGGRYVQTGSGDLFLEDVCGGQFQFRGINVWARQLNPENKDTKVVNDGGRFWCLGLKTENEGTILETLSGGKSEIVGGFIYAQGKPKTTPMFIVRDSSLSATVGETTWNSRNFKTILEETRGSETRTLEHSKKIPWRSNGASMLPLLTAGPQD